MEKVTSIDLISSFVDVPLLPAQGYPQRKVGASHRIAKQMFGLIRRVYNAS